MPERAEALGPLTLALMLFAQAWRAARRDEQGRSVPLTEQDPADWNAALLAQAKTKLCRACVQGQVGRFQLEAALQSAHLVRRLVRRRRRQPSVPVGLGLRAPQGRRRAAPAPRGDKQSGKATFS